MLCENTHESGTQGIYLTERVLCIQVYVCKYLSVSLLS